MTPTVIFFLKAPRVGFVKTRLARECGADRAAEIYSALAEAQGRRIPPGWKSEIHFAPADAEAEMRGWLGNQYVFRPQADGDLGGRLIAGFGSALAGNGGPVIAIGGDCPDLDAACLEEASHSLRTSDVVLGPAIDGGYYLIGLNHPQPELFIDVPWSTPEVLGVTQERARLAGLRYHLLAPKSDIDDAVAWRNYEMRERLRSALTVIVPTLNEAARIQHNLETTRAALPGARVIVVDGGSTDATATLARSAGAEVVHAGRGRGVQLAAGAAPATTEWLLFLHADTTLPSNAGNVIETFMSRPGAQIATFRLRFDHAGWFLRVCCWFTRCDSVFTRFGDQGILVRREFYYALGGFPAWPLFEDVELLRRARRKARVVSLPAAVTTSARRFENMGHFSQQWLNARLLFRFLLGSPPERLGEIYRASARSKQPAQTVATLPLNEAE
jgi:uncharacterized protein